MRPSASSFAAALARAFALLQSAPPSLFSRTRSLSPPPMYLEMRSSEVAGTYRKSVPANAILMKSRSEPSTVMRSMPINRPIPWCSCTTRSPGVRSVYDFTLSRLDFLTCVFFRRARTCPSVMTTRPRSGYSKPADSVPSMMLTQPPLGSRSLICTLRPVSVSASSMFWQRSALPHTTATARPCSV